MSDDDQLQEFCSFGNMMFPVLQNRDSTSPPKAQVDEASLQQAMDKNKESLKVKLMTRRPISQLVEQGIFPSLKGTPHFYVQRQKLERAKTGDFLKNKIQRRPDRQELIQQHILEDTTVDPSLHDKQRQLKKARLADDLNDRLSHRPGPLELVKGNILLADEKLAQAVKEGQIQFKRTCEGQSLRHPPPSFVVEDDSGSDVALSPPQDSVDQCLNSIPSVESIPSPYTSLDSPTNAAEFKPIAVLPAKTTPSSSPTGNINFVQQTDVAQKESQPNVIRIRKKSKSKSQPKPRTIKFHEYKGPPSALKNQAIPSMSETSYELLLKQQQLFLQWQLELQQKYPQMILPVSQKPTVDQNQNNNIIPSAVKEQSPDVIVQKCWSKLEDMKVSDLKAELKKRNLPVSGSKPQLIERLKPYSDFTITPVNKKILPSVPDSRIVDANNTGQISVGSIISIPPISVKTEPVTSVMTMDTSTPQVTLGEHGSLVMYNTLPIQGQITVTSRPSSVAPMEIEVPSPCSSENTDAIESSVITNENIVKLQQKRIQELQRELERSQRQLQEQQWLQQRQALLASQPVPIAPSPVNHIHVPVSSVATLPQPNNLDTTALQKLQQHLQQKLQNQQLLQQLQASNANNIFPAGSAALSAAVKANLAAFIHNQQNANHSRLTAIPSTVNQHTVSQLSGLHPIMICHPGINGANGFGKPRANSVPNGIGQQKLIWTPSLPNFSILTTKPANKSEPKLIPKLPPDYNEATKQLNKSKPESKSQTFSKQKNNRKSVKSKAVDDVLEVLIKSGELPPSAAQAPPTPTTPETEKITGCSTAPIFPPKVPVIETCAPPPPPPPPPPNSHNLKSNTQPNLQSSLLPEDSNKPLPLDIDFHLELQDIEMDLSVLDQPNVATPQTLNSVQDVSTNCEQNTPLSQMTYGERSSPSVSTDIDMELSDFLDNFASSPFEHQSPSDTNPQHIYNSGCDPLLSNVTNNQDAFDMFSLEDMDFKSQPDLSVLSWDKVDFAT